MICLLGGETSLEQCLSEARIAGFSIESGKISYEFKRIITKIKRENLQLCSGWYGANFLKTTQKEMELMSKQLQLFIECKFVWFCKVTG